MSTDTVVIVSIATLEFHSSSLQSIQITTMTQVHLSWDRLGMQQTCSCMYAVSDNFYSACSSYPRIILGWTRTPTPSVRVSIDSLVTLIIPGSSRDGHTPLSLSQDYPGMDTYSYPISPIQMHTLCSIEIIIILASMVTTEYNNSS